MNISQSILDLGIQKWTEIWWSEYRNSEEFRPSERVNRVANAMPLFPDRLPPEHILHHNRRFVPEDKIEGKLAKAFDIAQTKKDEVCPSLSRMWQRANTKDFVEKEQVQTEEGMGSTIVKNTVIETHLGISSTQGWKVQMEDFYITDSFLIEARNKDPQAVTMYGVFDGHLGSGCADYLQAHIKNYLKEHLDIMLSMDSISETAAIFNVLKNAFVNLGQSFIETGLCKSKSTALIALIIGDYLWVANVGDSRAILLDGDETIALSIDAKPDDEMFAKGVRKRGGKVKKQPYGISRVYPVGCATARAVGYDEVGTGINPRAKIIRYPLTSPHQKTLILACDGVWDFASTNQVADFIREMRAANPNLSVGEIAQLLVAKTCRAAEIEAEVAAGDAEAEVHPQGDNLTVIASELPVPQAPRGG